MKRNFLPVSIAMSLALAACGGQSESPSTASAPVVAPVAAQSVSGPAVRAQVDIDQVAKLPPGLTLGLRLVDTTDAANLPVVVAESSQPAPGVLPFDAALAYDPALIDAGRSYGFQVSLMAETLVLYGTSAPVPVLTSGAPSDGLKITLVRGGQPAADVPPGDLAKSDFAKLEANLGALRRIQGERLEADVAVGWDAFVESDGQIRMAREQVDFGDAGSAQYRYAYKGGKPWVVERSQAGVKTLVAWNDAGDLVLNEKGKGEADLSDVDGLRSRAEALYTQAAAKR